MEQDSLKTKIGAALRAQRNHWGLSQERLAQRVGLTTRYIAGLERSEFNVTVDTLDELARILGLDPVALLNGELRDELPEQRDAPADANPVKRRRKNASRASALDDF
ncbi:helix-turn-helix domain-containing protein [Leucobacter albus]|uniref:Helix-turn-helix domain-containing protein n=1 Tax=Leucobacter albus TaxID=272210 RepID=A0ABW3TR86_9MICO